MAIGPESSETFAREVDENLRRDRMRDAAESYGKWVVLAILLLLGVIGGYLFWRDQQTKQAATDGEALSQALDDIGSGNLKAVPAQLAPLKDARSDAISVSARLTDAALALQQNDRARALGLYREIAADSGVAQPWRDLATIRQTALEFDTLQPPVIIDRLAPLTHPGHPWFGSAGEMTALAMLKGGRKSEAGRLFGQIANDKTVPQTIRGRAVQIAGSLGVDASAALPASS
ncbi:MAG: tetratricopeptide repeat protein [Sphingomicrobium sp.]